MEKKKEKNKKRGWRIEEKREKRENTYGFGQQSHKGTLDSFLKGMHLSLSLEI